MHAERAPFQGFGEGEEIGDHDMALAYVLECDADAIPLLLQPCEEAHVMYPALVVRCRVE